MQKITPHIWFNTQAKEASEFYKAVFPDSKTNFSYIMEDTPSGIVDVIGVQLLDFDFVFISAGPIFTPNASISFMVLCEIAEEVEKYWEQFSESAKILMPLDKYDFSEKYGWLEDKFGVSWQFILSGGPVTQKIIPSLLFVGELCGKAKEAAEHYTSIFKKSELRTLYPYGPEQKENNPEHIMYGDFKLEDVLISVMDSGLQHNFAFNEGISLIVNCETQEEVDYYWQKLSADPKSEQCGWLKDKFGVSWQVVPVMLDQLYAEGDKVKNANLTQALLEMKKFDIAELEAAYHEIG